MQLIPSGFGNDQMLPKPEDLLMSNGMMSMPMQVPQPLPMVAMGEQVRKKIGTVTQVCTCVLLYCNCGVGNIDRGLGLHACAPLN